MKRYIIGIDPDTKKSGFAIWDKFDKEMDVQSLTFFEILELLKDLKEGILFVRIEAGWLNKKSNFHSRYNQSKEAGERIAKNVGANHETGRKLGEMCEYLDIKFEFVKPIGTKAIDHFYFQRLTGFKGRTNQDMRDAGMLVYGY